MDFLFARRRYKFILSARGANAFVLGEPDFDVVDLELPRQANIVDHLSIFRDIKSLLYKETWIDQQPPNLQEHRRGGVKVERIYVI